MSNANQQNWLDHNQTYLMAAVTEVRLLLESHAGNLQDEQVKHPQTSTLDAQQDTAQDLSMPPALTTLCQVFGLSDFERAILLVCVGVEMDSSFAALIASIQNDARQPAPTFSLAMSVFPDAYWSALAPTAPLRHWRLIEVGSGDRLTNSPLQIDERILHYLTGVSYLDSRLRGMIKPVQQVHGLLESQREIAEKMVNVWLDPDHAQTKPIVQISGAQYSSKPSIAASACAAMGLQLHIIHCGDIPTSATEREALSCLWAREAVLSESALLVDCETIENQRAVSSFLENTHGIIIISAREPLSLNDRTSVSFEVPKSSTQEQLDLWHQVLGTKAQKLNGQLEHLAWQFHMDEQAVHAVTTQLSDTDSALAADALGAKLWDACRIQARQRLDGIAQRIEPLARWEDLVLPQAQINTLREIAMHVRQRAKVYERWGFAAKASRGLGISALFSGPSGTGKTMAAEVLANELRLDLYHIDLSQVVNKYIGETEKNLSKVFDVAEQSGAILFFDEADSLFGKRSDVKDSHDRHANIEVSYLLQRMESYSGLALLTTNMKQALDQAFLRRIRFTVQFPFPGIEQRAEIWKRIFPSQTPTEALDICQLSRLDVAGGNIRNIAMNAAFLAAENNEAVTMPTLAKAARSELGKLEKSVQENELRNWV